MRVRIAEHLQLLSIIFPSQNLSMEQTSTYWPQLSIRTDFGHAVSLVVLTVSLMVSEPSSCSPLRLFSASVQTSESQTTEQEISLSPPKVKAQAWQGFHIITVTDERFPSFLRVSFWSHSDRPGFDRIKVGLKEALFRGLPEVSLETQSCWALN